MPEGDTIVCRCEEVTAGRSATPSSSAATGPNQMKAFLRCGMGPCQGRLCGLTVTELIAAARGVAPDEVGYYRLRPPVKPITLAELAACRTTDRGGRGGGAADEPHRRRHRHRRRHPRLLHRAASGAARPASRS